MKYVGIALIRHVDEDQPHVLHLVRWVEQVLTIHLYITQPPWVLVLTVRLLLKSFSSAGEILSPETEILGTGAETDLGSGCWDRCSEAAILSPAVVRYPTLWCWDLEFCCLDFGFRCSDLEWWCCKLEYWCWDLELCCRHLEFHC